MTNGQLDLWFWALSGPGIDPACYADMLSSDERARADRFVKPDHQDEYRVGRGKLRQILGRYTGINAANLRFDYNGFGKPGLVGGPSFNLSHSGGIACLAVHATQPLGVDIEAFRQVDDGVARRFFSATEYDALCALPPDRWSSGFFRCWTRKEAFVKACGPGLSMPLDSFDVTLAPDQPARFTRIEGYSCSDWQLIHMGLHDAMVGAVAIQSPTPIQVVLRDAPKDLRDQIYFA